MNPGQLMIITILIVITIIFITVITNLITIITTIIYCLLLLLLHAHVPEGVVEIDALEKTLGQQP